MLPKPRSSLRCFSFTATLNQTFWQHFYDAGSLTVKLKQAAVQSFQVDVLSQALCVNQADFPRQMVWQRHVYLKVDGAIWIEAFTFIPLKTLHPKAKHLLYLRHRPLGEVLFKDRRLARSAFELREHRQAKHVLPKRTCHFIYAHSPIYVQEIFYPQAISYFSQAWSC